MGQLRVFPRAQGPATNVVVTEYELPHVLLATHDVAGDSKGNIWYSSHRTPFMGKLDPKTGIVTEYQVPPTPPGVLPGTHRMQVDKNDIVWASENWAHNAVRFDPSSETFLKIPLPSQAPINAPMGGNLTAIARRQRALARAGQGGGRNSMRRPASFWSECRSASISTPLTTTS